MRPHEERDLDRKIREALQPDADAVQRVVCRALAMKEHRRFRLAPPLVAIGVCVVAWLVYIGLPGEPPQILTLDCIGEVAVVRAPDGTSWVFSPDGREPGHGADEGLKATGLILYEEDLP